MSDYRMLHRRLMRLEASRERERQQEEDGVSVVFCLPDIDGESVPDDAPPADADGLRPYHFYLLPVKK